MQSIVMSSCNHASMKAHSLHAYRLGCSVGTDGTQHSLVQPSGMQLRLLVNLCTHDISAIAYSPAAHAVVAGDRSGGVLAIDVSTPAVLW